MGGAENHPEGCGSGSRHQCEAGDGDCQKSGSRFKCRLRPRNVHAALAYSIAHTHRSDDLAHVHPRGLRAAMIRKTSRGIPVYTNGQLSPAWKDARFQAEPAGQAP